MLFKVWLVEGFAVAFAVWAFRITVWHLEIEVCKVSRVLGLDVRILLGFRVCRFCLRAV